MEKPSDLPLADELRRRGIRPNRKLGQNFMVDRQMLDFLVRSACLSQHDVVLEVGTGAGFLTQRLCEEAGEVISVEIDSGLFDLSRERLGGYENLVLIHADALAKDGGWNGTVKSAIKAAVTHASGGVGERFQTIERSAVPGSRPGVDMASEERPDRPDDARRVGSTVDFRPLKMVANLPYSIATAVVQTALAGSLEFADLWFTCQKEVAERLSARPGSENYGFISVLVALLADIHIVRRLPATVFWPRPKVESAIVEIVPSAAKRQAAGDVEYLKVFLSRVFTQRRKRLVSVLKAMGLDERSILEAGEILDRRGAPPAERVFRITPEALARIAECFANEGGRPQ